MKLSPPRRQHGFLLIAVVVILAVLAAVAMTLTASSSMDNALAARNSETAELDYVTESGLQHAKWRLAQNTSCAAYTSMPSTPFGAHSYAATFTPASGSPVAVTVTGTLANGATLSKVSAGNAAYQAPANLALQPGAAGIDTYIRDGANDSNNFGASAILKMNNASAEEASLLKFNLAGIPASAEIQSAVLHLWLEGGTALSNGVIDANRVTRDWVEGSKDGQAPPAGGGATYNSYNGQNNWTSPGGDYATPPLSTVTIPNLAQGWHQWNLTSAVQDWVSGVTANHGVLLRASGGNVDKIVFTSGDGNATTQPKLVLSYSCECGVVCAGGPGMNLLMVVSDPSNMVSQDIDKKALIESWGYTVALIDDNASQSQFDAATATASVAYVSASVSDTTLGTKLVATSIGVVNEKPGSVDEFGFSQFNVGANRTEIDVIDSSHYITSGYASGLLTLHSVSQPTYMLNGTLAPGLTSLANGNGSAGWTSALAVIDQGGGLYGGGTAAGRRAKLPWGGASFVLTNMNSDGQTIMRRAIEWAATPPDAGAGPKKVLFVVGSVGGSGMTAAEIAHKNLIESWGHTVEIIDDNASQAEFDVAVATSDVVFTTNDITANNLGTKLVSATIGVVTSEDNLSDEFGMASSIAWESGTVLEVNDNTHYITSPFSLGILTYSSANQSLAYVTGTLSPDLARLASSSSGYGVVTLDAGASLFGGGSATGRRVQLPWGGSPSLLPSNLTADGITILKRAIEWGAGAGGGSITIQVSDGNDDAEQLTSNGVMEIASTDLEIADNLAATGLPSDIVGIRFPNVTIPQGESITNAYIQFQVDELDSGAASLTIEGEAVDSAAQFTSAAYNITLRPRTAASVLWAPPVWTTVGERGLDQRTVDISPVIQEIVNRPGWSSGNALGIIIRGTGTRTAEAYEGDPVGAPALHIDYGATGGGGGGSGGACNGNLLDRFNAVSYGNSDGTLPWATNWLEINESDGPTTGDEAVDDNDSDYHLQVRDNDGGGEGVQREANLSARTTATFSFEYRRYGFDNSNDFVMVHVSNNGGTSWTELDRMVGPGTDSNYVPRSYDISSYISSNTRIRFLTSPDLGSGDEMYIDNVQIAVTGCE